MGEIAWNKIVDAISRRDVRSLERLATKTNHEERRKLLQLFAEIVGSGLPTSVAERSLPRIIARLTYDSFRDPLVAGVRGEQPGTRQALYEAGPYCVDLRLERERRSGTVTLTGQIADRERPETNLGEVPVVLMSGKAVVARAHSNLLGEFQIEYAHARNLRLYLPVERRGKGIEVPLNHLQV